MEQMQPAIGSSKVAPTGVIANLVGEDQEQRRRIVWAVAGAIVIHLILFLLNLTGWGRDLIVDEIDEPERLIAVNLQMPRAAAGGGGANRPVSRPPEPVKVKLPFKSEFVPTPVPVPELPEDVPEELKLPSMENKALTSDLNIGPVLAPEGAGGMGGPNGRGTGPSPGAGVGPGGPTAGRGGYGKPHITFKPKPEWTEEARRNRIQGQVILRAVFAADGTVRNIRVLKGLGYGLDEKAIKAAKLIRFIPARGPDGRPASVRATISVEFTLL